MYVSRVEFERRLCELEERMERMSTSQQGEIDALRDELVTVAEDLGAAAGTIQAEVDSLEAQIQAGTPPEQLDLAALKDAAAALDPAVQRIAAIQPTPAPAPTPTPAPTPSPAPDAALYVFDGDPTTVDQSVWPSSGLETTDATPRPLFTFAQDQAGQPPAGDGADGGLWHVYTGPTQPVGSTAPPTASDAAVQAAVDAEAQRVGGQGQEAVHPDAQSSIVQSSETPASPPADDLGQANPGIG